jgi:ornithine cyclodeaminase/alanine dehydrogenase-like protein (mu-crystallin family)
MNYYNYYLLQYVKLSGGPPRILTVVGCGVQARSHVEALRVICQFDEVVLIT